MKLSKRTWNYIISLYIKSESVQNVRDQASPSLVPSTADKGLHSFLKTEFAFVNEFFRNKRNAEIGHYGQTLIKE